MVSTERIMICPAPVLAAALSLTHAPEGLMGTDVSDLLPLMDAGSPSRDRIRPADY